MERVVKSPTILSRKKYGRIALDYIQALFRGYLRRDIRESRNIVVLKWPGD
jgi:hypothetical protein